MCEEAVNRECLSDLAQIIIDYENNEIDESTFRMKVIDRIYELDEPRELLED